MNAHSWTPEKIALLTEMWKAGKSAAQISKKLGTHSRNAVIGKAKYLRDGGINLELRDSKINRGYEHRTKPSMGIPKPKATKPPQTQTPASEAPVPCGPVGAFPEDGCQFITGPYTPDFVMCGHPLVRGKWCKFHSEICFAPA